MIPKERNGFAEEDTPKERPEGEDRYDAAENVRRDSKDSQMPEDSQTLEDDGELCQAESEIIVPD